METDLVNVSEPFADVFEALGVGDVIYEHDSHGPSVVRGSDGVKPFLSRCIPAQTQSNTSVQPRHRMDHKTHRIQMKLRLAIAGDRS